MCLSLHSLAAKPQEGDRAPPAGPTEAELHLQGELGRLQLEREELRGHCQAQVRDNEQLSRLNREQEERLLELEKTLQRYKEEDVDRQQILENMQSDKATISRALSQNRELKEQLAELQNGFVKLVRPSSAQGEVAPSVGLVGLPEGTLKCRESSLSVRGCFSVSIFSPPDHGWHNANAAPFKMAGCHARWKYCPWPQSLALRSTSFFTEPSSLPC